MTRPTLNQAATWFIVATITLGVVGLLYARATAGSAPTPPARVELAVHHGWLCDLETDPGNDGTEWVCSWPR